MQMLGNNEGKQVVARVMDSHPIATIILRIILTSSNVRTLRIGEILAMWMRFFLCLFVVLMSASCSHKVLVIPASSQKALHNRPMPAFNQVMVEGNINVKLRTGFRHPRLLLRGDPLDLLQVQTSVVNNTLHVSVGNGYPKSGPISVEIQARYLNSFTYHGSGVVTGKNLHSSLLDVSIDNPGQTILGGQIVLRKLEVKGGGYTQVSGVSSQYLQLSIINSKVQLAGRMNISRLELDEKAWVAMYWVKSHALVVRGKGQSFMQLAGIVDKLDVELCDRSRFNGRYLRANRAFVKTHDHSVADISAVNHQHTLATDASDIYFYNVPTIKTDFMAYNGSVLDMRDWSPWDRSVYTRYNKP
ncbi:GIN domain-containing protein [Legionella jordanis]|nr:DUF2807 domain-containing protein [Legionella jordanis]